MNYEKIMKEFNNNPILKKAVFPIFYTAMRDKMQGTYDELKDCMLDFLGQYPIYIKKPEAVYEKCCAKLRLPAYPPNDLKRAKEHFKKNADGTLDMFVKINEVDPKKDAEKRVEEMKGLCLGLLSDYDELIDASKEYGNVPDKPIKLGEN